MSVCGPEATTLALFVSDVDVVGGSERQALLLARTLVGRGVPVDLITCTSPELLRPPRRWVERRDGVRLVRLPRLLVEPVAGALLGARRGALRGLVAVGLMMGAIAARIGRALDLPVVVKLAGAGAAGDMAALARLPAADRARVLDDLRRAHVVCVTEAVAREALAAGLPAARLARIPNGVDLAAVSCAAPARLHEGPTALFPTALFPTAVFPTAPFPTALFVGRLDPAKGADTLVQAFAAVARDVPDAALLLAGEGPERPALEALAARLGLGPRVRFLGRRDDPFALLRGATVVVVPSRSEGLSNTLLEALAAGCAVVASGIDPNREVTGDDAALLVPPDDPAALAAALTQALRDPDLRARLGAAARARAADFAIERVADEYLALLARLGPPPDPGRVRVARGLARARLDDLLRTGQRALRRALG